MDVIRFASGFSIYRPTGGHDFAQGAQDVLYVRQTDLTLPRLLRSPVRSMVKNLCGRFTTFLDGYGVIPHQAVSMESSTSYFGRHQTLHHLHGTATVHCGVVYFKGCGGAFSIARLSEDLFLGSPSCEVHMGVFKACLGRRLSTAHGCYLENAVSRRFRCMRVRRRLDDSTQAVKLRIDTFDEEEFPHLRGKLAPTSVDLSVTGTGVLLLRFSWSRCGWNEECESAALRFCDWAADELRACC
jgi:hypothetical protein